MQLAMSVVLKSTMKNSENRSARFMAVERIERLVTYHARQNFIESRIIHD